MKVYKVKVNGKLYEVELEAVSEVAGSVSAPVATKTEPAPVASAPVSAGAKTIVAPIAGKVLSIPVKVGDKVAKNQTVAVIEAMKLENEVPSPVEGTVAEIKISAGAQVNNKDVLIVLG